MTTKKNRELQLKKNGFFYTLLANLPSTSPTLFLRNRHPHQRPPTSSFFSVLMAQTVKFVTPMVKNAQLTGVFDLWGADFSFLQWAGAGRWRGRGSCGFFRAVATLRPHPSATLLMWPPVLPDRNSSVRKKSTCLCNIMSGSMEYCVAKIHYCVTNTYFTLSA